MRFGSGLDRFASSVLVVCLGVVVSGTKACQTDYEVGVQAKVPSSTQTGTPTITGTAQLTGTITGTVTPNSSGTAVSGATPTVDATLTAEATIIPEAAGAQDDLFNELSKLGVDPDAAGKGINPGAASVVGALAKPDNWLGEAYSKDDDSLWQDSDGDGFSDKLEEELGSDVNSAGAAPRSVLVTRLDARVTNDELASDILEKSEATTEPGVSVDTDRDGVTDEKEAQLGTNPNLSDSDGDGLSDGKEQEISSNPLKIDSDGDGVADGREYDLGADPTIPEPR